MVLELYASSISIQDYSQPPHAWRIVQLSLLDLGVDATTHHIHQIAITKADAVSATEWDQLDRPALGSNPFRQNAHMQSSRTSPVVDL